MRMLHTGLKIALAAVFALVCETTLALAPKTGNGLGAEESIKLLFRFSKSNLEKEYLTNTTSLQQLSHLLSTSTVDSLFILSTASPDGVAENNMRLAHKRAQAVKGYLLWKYPQLRRAALITSYRTAAWEELLPAIEADRSFPHKSAVIQTIKRRASAATTEWRLKQIGGGEAWNYIEKRYLYRLRTGGVEIQVYGNANSDTTERQSGLGEGVPLAPSSEIELLSETNLPERSSVPATTKKELRRLASARCVVGIKTNLAELAAGVANIGMEFKLGKRLSLDLPFTYSPYTIARDYSLRLMALQPELRYWFRNAFFGHFIGVHATGVAYNVSICSERRYQSDRMAYGAGLSYGYAARLGKHWSMEFTVGAGYLNTAYNSYYNVPNGMLMDSHTKHYWGITRASVGIVYLINRNRP